MTLKGGAEADAEAVPSTPKIALSQAGKPVYISQPGIHVCTTLPFDSANVCRPLLWEQAA